MEEADAQRHEQRFFMECLGPGVCEDLRAAEASPAYTARTFNHREHRGPQGRWKSGGPVKAFLRVSVPQWQILILRSNRTPECPPRSPASRLSNFSGFL